jgi:hypothetical protein
MKQKPIPCFGRSCGYREDIWFCVGWCFIIFSFSFHSFPGPSPAQEHMAAIAAVALVFSAIFATQVSSLITSTSIVMVIGIWIFAYFRFGLLAIAASYLFAGLLDQFPIPTPLSA